MRSFRKCPKCDRQCAREKRTKRTLEYCPVCNVSLKNQPWYIDYYSNGERKREAVGTNKRFVEEVMAKRRVQNKENQFFDVKRDAQVTLDEIAADFLNYSRINKHRSVSRKDICIQHLLSFFPNKKLHQITPYAIEKYKEKRLNEDKRKPATVNREIAVLKAMFNLAIRHQKATINPMRLVRMLKEENIKLRILSDEEKKVLIECCTEPIKRIVMFALTTGLRRAEILSLKWEDIDIKHGIINIRHTKSGKDRIVHLRSFLERILKECYNSSDGTYVFCNEQKQAYKSINSLFQNIVKRTKLEHFSFHTLRHTAASDMLDMGVDIVTVKEILGHSDLKVTLRYAHSKSANKMEAVDKLSSRIDTFSTLPCYVKEENRVVEDEEKISKYSNFFEQRKDGRVVDGAGLENRFGALLQRGFKSLSFR